MPSKKVTSGIQALLLVVMSVFTLAALPPFKNIFDGQGVTINSEGLVLKYVPIGKELKSIHLKPSPHRDNPQQKRILNLKEKSSIRLLTTSEQLANYRINSESLATLFGNSNLNNYFVFSNFVHGMNLENESMYWIAVIPRFNFEFTDILFQVEWFVEGAGAHAQVRMKFDQPILLIPQSERPKADWFMSVKDMQGLPAEEALAAREPIFIPGDLVYTLLAVRTLDGEQNWDPVKGLTGSFANAYSFQSTMHVAKDQTRRNYVTQYKLKLSDDKVVEQHLAKNIFQHMLEFSDFSREQRIYNTVFDSCVTAAFSALSAKGRGIVVDPYTFNPYRILSSLERYLDSSNSWPSLNEEFKNEFSDVLPRLENEQNANVLSKVNSPEVKSIITSREFDVLVKKMAYEIVEREFTYDEVAYLLGAIRSIPSGASSVVVYQHFLEHGITHEAPSQRLQDFDLFLEKFYQFIFDELKVEKIDSTVLEVLENLAVQN